MKRLFLYASLLMVVIVPASCDKEDNLYPIPTTAISDASAFASPDRILNQVRGLYATMRNGAFYGGRYLIYNDIRGEEFINELTNDVTGLSVWSHTMNNSTNNVKDRICGHRLILLSTVQMCSWMRWQPAVMM
jgi:starch-binding outer membrane protein, SusD/RagB family